MDATNWLGETMGVFYLNLHDSYHFEYVDHVLWDKYWALGPNVTTFWRSLVLPQNLLFRQEDILKNTPALWSDLGLVQRFAAKDSWLEGEVHKRIRASLRFVWIAVVVFFF